MKYSIFFITIIFNLESLGQKTTLNPYVHFCKKITRIKSNDTFNLNYKKILYDFDKDGLKDLAFSDAASEGKAGSEWYIYLKKNKKSYNSPIKYFFADWAFYTKKTENSVILINYFHVSANSGYLYYHKIQNKKLIIFKSVFVKDLTKKNKKVEMEFSKFNVHSTAWTPRCKNSGLANCYPTQF